MWESIYQVELPWALSLSRWLKEHFGLSLDIDNKNLNINFIPFFNVRGFCMTVISGAGHKLTGRKRWAHFLYITTQPNAILYTTITLIILSCKADIFFFAFGGHNYEQLSGTLGHQKCIGDWSIWPSNF